MTRATAGAAAASISPTTAMARARRMPGRVADWAVAATCASFLLARPIDVSVALVLFRTSGNELEPGLTDRSVAGGALVAITTAMEPHAPQDALNHPRTPAVRPLSRHRRPTGPRRALRALHATRPQARAPVRRRLGQFRRPSAGGRARPREGHRPLRSEERRVGKGWR